MMSRARLAESLGVGKSIIVMMVSDLVFDLDDGGQIAPR